MMAKATEKFEFTIQVEGKTYDCERAVSGTREFTQKIKVIGIGLETDSARYGPKRHRPESMESMAEQIAHEIVNKHLTQGSE